MEISKQPMLNPRTKRFSSQANNRVPLLRTTPIQRVNMEKSKLVPT